MKIKPIIIASALTALLSNTAIASTNEYHHFPGVFIGATTIDSETDFTYGIEYEYKATQLWGIGFVF
jgi:hypothetical protein